MPFAAVDYLLTGFELRKIPPLFNVHERGFLPQSHAEIDRKREGEPRVTISQNVPVEIPPITIPKRLIRSAYQYHINRVHRREEQLQLLLKLPAKLSNGETTYVSALVDTGAQVNLMRGGCVPAREWSRAAEALSFLTASGERLAGGS